MRVCIVKHGTPMAEGTSLFKLCDCANREASLDSQALFSCRARETSFELPLTHRSQKLLTQTPYETVQIDFQDIRRAFLPAARSHFHARCRTKKDARRHGERPNGVSP